MSDLKARAEAAGIIQHYSCDEDPWYSCPQSSDGTSNDEKGPDCDCGYHDRLNRLLAFAQAERQLALEEAAKVADGYCCGAAFVGLCSKYDMCWACKCAAAIRQQGGTT